MKCAKPNNNGEYAEKRVGLDRERRGASTIFKAIIVPLLLITIFTIAFLGMYDFIAPNYKVDTANAATDCWLSHAAGMTEGAGTSGNPYLISNAAQLAYLAVIISDRSWAGGAANPSAYLPNGSVAYSTYRQAYYKLT